MVLKGTSFSSYDKASCNKGASAPEGCFSGQPRLFSSLFSPEYLQIVSQSPYNSPMKRLATLSPSQLVWLSIAGGLIASTSFFALTPVSQGAFGTHLLISLALLASGFTLNLKANSSLKDGIANQQWSPKQIDPLRSRIDSPIVFVPAFSLLLTWFIMFLVFPHGRIRVTAYSFYVLGQTLLQLVYACRETAKPADPLEWQNFKPIQSEHWGQH